MIKLNIDGIEVTVEEGTTILEAARQVQIKIPTLCYLKEINEIGSCRMCLVEIEGRRGYVASCIEKARGRHDCKNKYFRFAKNQKNNVRINFIRP